MKKLLVVLGLIASVALYAEGNKVEVRVGGDIMPQFSVDGPEKDAEFSYELGWQRSKGFKIKSSLRR